MSEPSAVETPAPTSLSDHLQYLTETLAGTHTQEQVFAATLSPALAALNAVAGTVLLLDPQTQCLSVAALQGQDPQTVWQDSPLSPGTPAGDVLRTRQAMHFEHAEALKVAYPHLEAQTGAIAPVATTVLPLPLEGQALGVLTLDFQEPHTFTSNERRFLSILAAQTSLALDRAQMLQQREAEAAHLRSSEARFRRMVEVSPVSMAVGSLDGRLTLVNDAYLHLLGYTRAEYEAGEIDWQALTPEEYRAQDTWAFEAAFSQGISTTYEKEMLTKAGERLPLELTLIRYDPEQVVGYLKDLRIEKAQAQLMADQAATLQAEQDASQAFMAFTEAASHFDDLDQLARLALDTLQVVLPGSSAVFYDRAATSWQPRVWTGDLNPELLAVLRQGLPLETPVFAELLRTETPVFVDGWTEAAQGVAHTGQFQTVATYPVTQRGQIRAVLSVALQDQPRWSEAQRATVRSVGRSFTLLYERIATTLEVVQRRKAEEQRALALEAFEQLSRELIRETDRYTLIQRALEIMRSMLTPGFLVHHELEDGRWRIKAQTGDMGSVELQRLASVGWPFEVPTLHLPWTTGQDLYQDQYAQGSDTEMEVVEHVNTTATLVVRLQGQAIGLIVIGLFDQRPWTSVDRVILNTARQSLELALDRAAQTRQLEMQRAVAERRSDALEAFAALTSALDVSLDRLTLIRRAQGLLLSLLPPGYATYYEVQDGRYRVLAQTGEVGTHEFQAAQDAGFPLGETPTLDRAWASPAPTFIGAYDTTTDIDPEVTAHLRAGALLPLRVQGEQLGLFTVGLFETQRWDRADEAVVASVVQSLTLTLERSASVLRLAESARTLAQSNEELQATNEELEAFTYSVSHDLRTPVRHVMGFAELAEKALQETPNARAGQHLQVVKQAALRMTDLIDSMLLLSRSGRQELHKQFVDLNRLVTQARRDVAAEFAHRQVHWQIGELPTVEGDPQLLQQVVTNLLSNAVKYSARREVSEVEVKCEEHESEWCLSVTDNGVGFDPKYAQKLFGIFQRLHTEKEFKGTGVGLATVKRIVQRHGGRAFAQSDNRTGATFGFTLPKSG